MLGFSKDFHQSTTLCTGQTVSMMIKPDAAVMLVIADLALCYPGCANKQQLEACMHYQHLSFLALFKHCFPCLTTYM